MKSFLLSITIITAAVILALTTSILLDIEFVQAQPIRKILIYTVIIIEIYIAARIVYLLNKK